MSTLYDSDFYAWSQEQAALLRRVRPADNALDVAHLAEEIADLGRSELNKVTGHLIQVLAHLLKAALDIDAPAQRHWRGEVVAFQLAARRAFTPSMRQHIDLDDILSGAVKLARAQLADHGVTDVRFPPRCTLTLDELLADDFDYELAVETLRGSLSDAN